MLGDELKISRSLCVWIASLSRLRCDCNRRGLIIEEEEEEEKECGEDRESLCGHSHRNSRVGCADTENAAGKTTGEGQR